MPAAAPAPPRGRARTERMSIVRVVLAARRSWLVLRLRIGDRSRTRVGITNISAPARIFVRAVRPRGYMGQHELTSRATVTGAGVRRGRADSRRE